MQAPGQHCGHLPADHAAAGGRPAQVAVVVGLRGRSRALPLPAAHIRGAQAHRKIFRDSKRHFGTPVHFAVADDEDQFFDPLVLLVEAQALGRVGGPVLGGLPFARNLLDRLQLHEITVRQDRDRVHQQHRMHRGVGEFQVLEEHAARLNLVEGAGEIERVVEQLEAGAWLAFLVDFQGLELARCDGGRGHRGGRVDRRKSEVVAVQAAPVVEQLARVVVPQRLRKLRPHRLHAAFRRQRQGHRLDAGLAFGGVEDLLDRVGRIGARQVLHEDVVAVAVEFRVRFAQAVFDRDAVVVVEVVREEPARAVEQRRGLALAAVLEVGGRLHMVHHPGGGGFVEPLVVVAAGLSVHAELQHVQEFMREVALPFLLLRCQRNASRDAERQEQFTRIEHDVGWHLLATVRVGEGDRLGAPGQWMNVDVHRTIAAVAGLLGVGQRKALEQSCFGLVDLLDHRDDEVGHGLGRGLVVVALQQIVG